MFRSNIKIRFIGETQPERRLERLLKRGLYDDAEQFAKIFGLDVQVMSQTYVIKKNVFEMVYVARINDLMEQISGADNDTIYKEVMKYIDLVQDDNIVSPALFINFVKNEKFFRLESFVSPVL